MSSCIFNYSKKTFSRIPGIKFLGNRNKLLHEQKHNLDKAKTDTTIHKINLDSSTSEQKTTPVIESLLKFKGTVTYSSFINEFNSIKSDFDIKRQPLSDEEIKIINLQEIRINDWTKIKLN